MAKRTASFPLAVLTLGLFLAAGSTLWAQPTELFISEYIEGSSNNKAIEIFNGTGAAVDLGAGSYNLQMYFNGNATAGLTINLTGSVANGDVWVVAHGSANATILAQADQTNSSGWFNGDDVVVLRKGTTVIDAIGQIGFDPGTEWGTGLVSTADNTLRRNVSVCAGDADGSNVFTPATEWDGYATDTFGGLGAHAVSCGEAPPSVTATTPATGASCVAVGSNISVTFSEAVNVTGTWFTISCTSGARTASVSGGPTAFTLDPATDFAAGDSCTVTIVAAQVSDQDLADPPDTMAANHAWTFTVPGGAVTPIHDIQGNGAGSPVVGATPTIRGIVTGVKNVSSSNRGFFVQQTNATVDADPATSEGILVYTASTLPTVSVGDLVEVLGTVSEFVPSSDPYQPPLTELTGPSVCVVSSGNPLPTAVALTAALPDPAGAYDQLERYEGMRVSVASLTVGGPTLGSLDEEDATSTSTGVFYGVVSGVARSFREPGIEHPDPLPTPVPRWDSNPEVLRVDTKSPVGGTALDVGTGAVVTNLVGPLDYTYRRYTIMVDPTTSPGVNGGPTLSAVTTPGVDDVTVASFNVARFFDTANDPDKSDTVLTATAFDNRLGKLSIAVRNYLRFPDVIGFEEVENLTTLQAIAARISGDALANAQADPLYVAYLEEGNDVGGIDVGFLVKTASVGSVPRVGGVVVTQYGLTDTWVDPNDGATKAYNDRPPLLLTGSVNFADGRTFPLTVIVNHLRSLNGVDDPTVLNPPDPTTEGDRVRQKRKLQAEFLANLIQARQIADPTARIVVLGDLNAYEFNDGYVDMVNTIAGTPTPDNETVVPGDGADLVDPDLTNLTLLSPAADRYSYVYDGMAQTLDHVLVNAEVLGTAIVRLEHARINADFADITRNNLTSPARTSDHDPAVAYLTLDVDGDGVADSADPCNDLLAPVFTVTYSSPVEIRGIVTDCSGIASLDLTAATNMILETAGNPGDTTWTWIVRLGGGDQPGVGTLVATDASAGAVTGTLPAALADDMAVPLLGGAGTAALVALVALAGVGMLRRSLLA